MLAIGLIGATVYLFTATQRTRNVALAKGVEEDDLTIFAVTLWLYVLPPIFNFFFAGLFNLYAALILMTFYVPGIVMSRKLSIKLSTGFDFERKAGREYDKALWLGIAGLGLVLLNLILFLVRNALPAR
jgi:hypothetical protein